ncbi:MAG: fibronectin type III domain-containing protein [Bryobacteraceae bacterium]
MAKVKLGLSTLTPQETIELTTQIVTMMTGNANFTTPNPALATITTQKNTTSTSITAYDTAKAAAETALATRDANVTVLKGLLTQLAAYVENVSGGDAVKIESAGMSVRSSRTPPTVPGQVLDLALTAGDFAGTLDVAFDPESGAKSYEVQTSPDPMSEASWVFKMSLAKSSGTIEGLTSGAKVWVRVRAIGSAGAGPWSDPATKVVP